MKSLSLRKISRRVLWLVLWLQLLSFGGFLGLVAFPLARHSAEETAGLMLIAAKTWEELPEDRREHFAQSLFDDTGMTIERGVLADISPSWRPHWYAVWITEAIHKRGESAFTVQMQHELVEVSIIIDTTPVVIRVNSPKLGIMLSIFLLMAFLATIGTLLSLWWQKRWQRQMLRSQIMLSGLSHDLRTPLTRLQLRLALLPNIHEHEQQELSQQIQQLSELIHTALALSHPNKTTTTHPVRMEKLWNEWQVHHDAVIFNITSTNCLETPVSPLLTRIMQNMIQNTLTHGLGQVTVNLFTENNDCIISITDEGNGIPKAVWKSIMREESPKAQGIGLGLLTSYWLCQHLNYPIRRVPHGVMISIPRTV